MIDVTGGCACGQVRYRASIEPDGYWCHCRMCQRAVGNVAAAFVNARQADIIWTGALAEWQSSAIARRGYCAACGTPLTFRYDDGDNIDLTVGSLDDPAAVRLTSHFGVESRVPGWIADDDLPVLRSANHAPLQARWDAAKKDGE